MMATHAPAFAFAALIVDLATLLPDAESPLSGVPRRDLDRNGRVNVSHPPVAGKLYNAA